MNLIYVHDFEKLNDLSKKRKNFGRKQVDQKDIRDSIKYTNTNNSTLTLEKFNDLIIKKR